MHTERTYIFTGKMEGKKKDQKKGTGSDTVQRQQVLTHSGALGPRGVVPKSHENEYNKSDDD